MKVRVHNGSIEYQHLGESKWWLCPPDRAERLAKTFDVAGCPQIARDFRKALDAITPVLEAAE